MRRGAVALFSLGLIHWSLGAESFEALRACEERPRQPITAEEHDKLPNLDAGPDVQVHGIDFHNRDLRGQTISNKWLGDANFDGADLRDTVFVDTYLAGASFDGACASGATFKNVNLTFAKMRNANLDFASFKDTSTRMSGVRFEGASLAGTDFGGLSLDNVSLAGARLVRANLEDASLVNADLTNAELLRTKISGAVWQPVGVPDLDQLGPLSGVDQLTVDEERADLAPLVLLESWLRERGYATDADAARYARLRAETCLLLSGQTAPLDPASPAERKLWARLEGLARWLLLGATIGYGYIPSRGVLAVFVCWLLPALVIYLPAFLMGRGRLFRVQPEGRITMLCSGGTAGWTVAPQNDIEVVQGGSPLAIIGRALVVSLESTLRVGVGRFNLAEFVGPLRPREVRYDAYGWLRIVMGVQALIGSYLLLVTAFAFLRRYVLD